MSRLCVPSTAVRDRLLVREPNLAIAVEAGVWEDVRELPDAAGDVEFWVPPFLLADAGAVERAFAAMPKLQVVQTQSAGVDVILPLVPDGVRLCDARGVHGSSTSEWVLTAILSVLRDFPRFVRAQIDHRWDTAYTDELAGKDVLIVGAGDVGQQLARRLRACDANPSFVARSGRDGVHAVAELPELLPEADVVVLIVPKTTETVGMVDARFLGLMRDGALLVNAARGPVVDTAALLAELRSGRLRAAVDVTDPEPLPSDHPLWNAPNLLITPHVAGSVLGLGDRFADLLAAQLRRFVAGQELQNVVTGDY